jgi:uncharacterized protein (DUF58 family)
VIVPTPRLLILALAGIPLVGLTSAHTSALIVASGWLIAIAALAVVDTHFVPGPEDLTWSREHDARMSIASWNRVRLSLRNMSSHSVRLQVRDAPPRWLPARDDSRQGRCDAGGGWQATYRVFPLHRGSYRFGPITARYSGPLGLAWKQRATTLDDEVQVYPDLLSLRKYDALARLGRLTEIGLRNARRWGEGTEFERLRAYAPDDEFRRINWKATARRREPIVADYQPERSQTVILAIDAGRLMAVSQPLSEEIEAGDLRSGSPPALARIDFAINAALLLAHVSQQAADRVGVLAFSDRVLRYLAPRSGRRQTLAVAQSLFDLEAEPTEPDFVRALSYLAMRSSRRSLVVLFTDLQEPESASALIASTSHLSRRHLVLVVTLRDPAVERLAHLYPADSQSVYERAMAMTVLEQRERTLTILRRAGILTLDVTGDSLSPSLINRYLEIKARGRL